MAKLTKLITLFGVFVLLSATAYAGGYNHDDDDDDHDGGKGGGGKGKKKICHRQAALIPSPIRFPNEKYLCCPDDHFLYKLEDKEERNGRSYSKFANVDRVTCSRYVCGDDQIVSVNKQETVAIYPFDDGSSSSSSSSSDDNGHDDDDDNSSSSSGTYLRRRLGDYHDGGDVDDADDDEKDKDHGHYDRFDLRCPVSPYNGRTRAITGFSHRLNHDLDDETTEIKGIVCADVDGARVDTHHCKAIHLGMKAENVNATRNAFQQKWWPLGLRVCPDQTALVALSKGKSSHLKWGLCCNIVPEYEYS